MASRIRFPNRTVFIEASFEYLIETLPDIDQ